MSSKSIRNDFWKKRVFLFDLDGTLYLGSKPIRGARELLSKLTQEKKAIYYLTNNSSRSEGEYVKKLRGLGFPVQREQIVMSTHFLVSFLQKKKWTKVFLLGTPAMKRMLQNGGVFAEETGAKAVVVGFDKTLTYKKLETACRLVEAGLPYIVTHPDLYCPTEKGPEPDCGAFAEVIRLVTQKLPLAVLGKPHPGMIREVQKRHRFSLREAVIVGDRLTTDILMAQRLRLSSVLVLSGETKLRNLDASSRQSLNIISSVRDLL